MRGRLLQRALRGVLGGAGAPATVALQAVRFAAGTGTTALSAGVPLAPGQLQPTALAGVSLWRSGTEVACYVEALEGRHPDGSVRSLLVQATSPAIASETPDTGWELRLSGGFTAARLSRNATPLASQFNALPDGVLLPTSAAHLCASRVCGRLLPLTTLQATLPSVWTTRMAQFSDDWLNDIALYGNGYDGSGGFPAWIGRVSTSVYATWYTMYSYWAITGDWRWWQRATVRMRAWITEIGPYAGVDLDGFVTGAEFRAETAGAEVYYWATGNVDGQRLVRGIGNQWLYNSRSGGGSDQAFELTVLGMSDRYRSRAFMAAIIGEQINARAITDVQITAAIGSRNDSWVSDTLAVRADTILRTHLDPPPRGYNNDGFFGAIGPTTGLRFQKNYMAGMLGNCYVRYADEINPSESRVATLLPVWANRLRTTEAVLSNGTLGLRYASSATPPLTVSECDDCTTNATGGDKILNGMVLRPVVWAWRSSGDTNLRTFADDLVAGLDAEIQNFAGYRSGKFLDESWYYFWQAATLRAGG